MKKPWFRCHGILCFPVNIFGWMVLLLALGLTIYSFIAIDSRSHSASDTLRNFIFMLVIIFGLYSGLGKLLSEKQGK